MYDANADMLAQAQKKRLRGEFLFQEKQKIYHLEITFLITLLLVLD